MSQRSTLLFLGAAALVVTFWMYGQQDVVVMLAEQLWTCF